MGSDAKLNDPRWRHAATSNGRPPPPKHEEQRSHNQDLAPSGALGDFTLRMLALGRQACAKPIWQCKHFCAQSPENGRNERITVMTAPKNQNHNKLNSSNFRLIHV